MRVQLEGERMLVRSGRSRFSLSTLPAADFPNLDDWQSEVEFTLPQATMKRLIEATQFSMAHQDVRYYLNGMLFETEERTAHRGDRRSPPGGLLDAAGRVAAQSFGDRAA